jgi:hypothetical protein
MSFSLYDVLSHGDLQKDPLISNALVWAQKFKDDALRDHRLKLKGELIKNFDYYKNYNIIQREHDSSMIQFYEYIIHKEASDSPTTEATHSNLDQVGIILGDCLDEKAGKFRIMLYPPFKLAHSPSMLKRYVLPEFKKLKKERLHGVDNLL